jgi:hypothetical protein
MADWIQRYSAALDARDTREQAHKPYIDACTRSHLVSKVLHMANTMTVDTALADRTAQLSRQQLQPASKPASPSPQSSQIPTSKERTGTPTKGNKDSPPFAPISQQRKRPARLYRPSSRISPPSSPLSPRSRKSHSRKSLLSAGRCWRRSGNSRTAMKS